MKYIIVTNAYSKNKSQFLQAARIAEELNTLGADCEIIKNINLAKINEGKIVAAAADVCVYLDKDRAAARMLEKSGIRLINSADAIEICDDKMLTHIALANNDIPMPDSVYAPLCFSVDAEADNIFLKEAETLGYPLVAKKCFGSLGAGVELI